MYTSDCILNQNHFCFPNIVKNRCEQNIKVSFHAINLQKKITFLEKNQKKWWKNHLLQLQFKCKVKNTLRYLFFYKRLMFFLYWYLTIVVHFQTRPLPFGAFLHKSSRESSWWRWRWQRWRWSWWRWFHFFFQGKKK